MRLGPDRYPVIGQHSPSAPSPLHYLSQTITWHWNLWPVPYRKKRTTYRLSGVNRPNYNICWLFCWAESINWFMLWWSKDLQFDQLKDMDYCPDNSSDRVLDFCGRDFRELFFQSYGVFELGWFCFLLSDFHAVFGTSKIYPPGREPCHRIVIVQFKRKLRYLKY